MSDPTKNGEALADDTFVEVRVVTTAALFPADGRERVPGKQKLSAILHRAAAGLRLTDTASYIVTVNGNPVDPTKNYETLGLSGCVDLRWGPEVGAGG